MHITAFICEFNPLHDGHRFFIRSARRQTRADYLIALMSGNWVQRGEPAVRPMHERALDALNAGADLVLQLPDAAACASAWYFASGGVRLLHSLNCVDTLCFGTECPDYSLLEYLGRFLHAREQDLQPLIRRHVASGMTYAAAREKAVLTLLGTDELPGGEDPVPAEALSELLRAPNNQLALAYLEALADFDSNITPCSVLRDKSYESSSQIRERLFSSHTGRAGSASESAAPALSMIRADDFSLLLKDRLLRLSEADLTRYLDVTDALANRIRNRQNEYLSWTQFTDLLHTREMSRARISRCLCHILLDMRKGEPLPGYLRILGFKKEAAPLLSLLKERSAIPLVTRPPLNVRDYASDLYQSVLTDKTGTAFCESHTVPVVTV